MNARELASRLDVSESMVSRLLSGERRPSADLMIRISSILPHCTLNRQAGALRTDAYGELLKEGLDKRSRRAVE